MPIVVRTVPDPWTALGLAAHYVSRQPPFSSFPSSDLILTLHRQIRRQHYLFAFDTSAAPAKVVGFFGWSLYCHADANAFAETGRPPADELGSGGDVLWILTAVASDRKTFFELVRRTREKYPDHRVRAVRNRRGRRSLMDQSRDRVARRRR